MITKRDIKVIEFIEKFGVANTSTIFELFYPSLQMAQRRLKIIAEKQKALKRERYHFTQEYIYYINKPKQLRHSLILSNFYRELHKHVEILKFRKEFTLISGIRPDAFIAYKKNGGELKLAFVEVEISNKGLDLGKYRAVKLAETYTPLPTMPKILVISDTRIKNDKELDIARLNTELKNLKNIL